MKNHLRITALASLAPAFAFVLIGASSTASGPSQPAQGASLGSSSPLRSSSTSNATSNAVSPAITNPYGCTGQSMNPHGSEHKPGNVTAESRTACPIPVSYIAVRGVLKHALGLGFEKTIATKYYSNYNARTATVHPGVACPQNNSEYVEYGYHTISEGGQNYYAETRQSAWVNNC